MKPLSFYCLRSVVKKEFRQIRRDARSLAFMIFLPAFMLLLFGFALNFDVKHIPLAVVDEDGSRMSRDLVDKFRTTEYFNLKAVLPRTAAIDPLMGFKLILSIFAAAILGGIGSATTAVGGAFFVGLAEEISTIWLPATYKSGIGFAMIVLILLFRPAGLFRRTRII